jgi:hypothetical protein
VVEICRAVQHFTNLQTATVTTTVIMEGTVLWDMVACSLIEALLPFQGNIMLPSFNAEE